MGLFNKHLEELDNDDIELEETTDSSDEGSKLDEFDEDSEPKKKKKSLKDLFKKKKKTEYLTDDDIAQNRKKVVNKFIILMSVGGFLLIIFAALIITLNKVQEQRKYLAKHPPKPKKTIALMNEESNIWKLQVDNELKNLKRHLIKNITDIKRIVKEENNATIMTINKLIDEKVNKKINNLDERINQLAEDYQNLKTFILQKNEETLTKAKAYALQKSLALEDKLKNLKSLSPVNVSITPTGNATANVTNKKNLEELKKAKERLKKLEEEEKKRKARIAYQKKVKEVEEEVSNLDVENIPLDENVQKNLNNKTKKKEEKIPYHLMTGFTKATLITGVSAPTFSSGLLNPKPVLLSVDARSIIANDQQENIKDCLLIGKATGNMVTSRAEILITRISCSIPTENPMIYKKIEATGNPIGWVIGEDGKYGLRGRLVDSAGKLILRQIMVGFLQGVSQAFAPSTIVPQVQATNPVQKANNALATGTASGVSNAFASLAEYYKKMLDGMYPYIDVMAGRKVTVLIKGFQDIKITKYKKVDISEENPNKEMEYEVQVDYDNF